MKKFFEEFKEFAIGGNLIDMAVGVIVGGAFNKIVGSLVADIFTPALGLLFGGTIDFSEMRIGGENGILIGNFINAVITFLLTALCLFTLIKSINAAKRKMAKPEEPAPEPAPAEPSDEVKLLTEIKDLLAKK
ncbi:MAG: large conductance mechanosensitive channel protein MscL [Erysipelotrichaceae bacterium]|nr:large conductance mechanosensitive channel protein MscL [Erysipelotrichaceae bacterium]